jgi:hypothetical protein
VHVWMGECVLCAHVRVHIPMSERCLSLLPWVLFVICVGLARTKYVWCIYGIFGREITNYTVKYGVYVRLWPNLGVWYMCAHVSVPCVCVHVRVYVHTCVRANVRACRLVCVCACVRVCGWVRVYV